jgi:hypothetical protein
MMAVVPDCAAKYVRSNLFNVDQYLLNEGGYRQDVHAVITLWHLVSHFAYILHCLEERLLLTAV